MSSGGSFGQQEEHIPDFEAKHVIKRIIFKKNISISISKEKKEKKKTNYHNLIYGFESSL